MSQKNHYLRYTVSKILLPLRIEKPKFPLSQRDSKRLFDQVPPLSKEGFREEYKY